MAYEEAIEEAIKELEYCVEENQGFMECRYASEETYRIAIEALEKQIPLPPKEYTLYTEDSEEVKYQGCPRCKAILGRSHYFLKVCSCGQQLEV